MPQANLEHDPMFQLLTDALRAGPESAEWREAVQRVTERGEAADEFTLLCKARERLAQGREYKSVRPGPTFTRKVMGKIDDEASQAKRGVPWANVIAVVSLAVMIGTVAAILFTLTSPANEEKRLLEGPFNTILFKTDLGPDISPEWVTFNGRHGGVISSVAFSPDKTIAMDVMFQQVPMYNGFIVRMFATTDPTQRAFLISITGSGWNMNLPNGTNVGGTFTPLDPPSVRLVLGPKLARIEANGKEVWSGPHLLSTSKQRYVGVESYNDRPLSDFVRSISVSSN